MAKPGKKKTATAPAKKKETQVEKVVPKKAPSSFDDIEQMFNEFFSRGWMSPLRFTHPS